MVEFYGTEREKGILNHIKYEERKMENDITSPCDVLQYYFLCYPFYEMEFV